MNKSPLHKRRRSAITKGLYREGPQLCGLVVGDESSNARARAAAVEPDDLDVCCQDCGHWVCSCDTGQQIGTVTKINDDGTAWVRLGGDQGAGQLPVSPPVTAQVNFKMDRPTSDIGRRIAESMRAAIDRRLCQVMLGARDPGDEDDGVAESPMGAWENALHTAQAADQAGMTLAARPELFMQIRGLEVARDRGSYVLRNGNVGRRVMPADSNEAVVEALRDLAKWEREDDGRDQSEPTHVMLDGERVEVMRPDIGSIHRASLPGMAAFAWCSQTKWWQLNAHGSSPLSGRSPTLAEAIRAAGVECPDS